MTPEKILELARQHGDHDLGDVDWYFYNPDLIAFAQAIIETEREISGKCKKLMAYKALVESLEARIASHESNRLRYQEARDTLESERECNARLTEELAEREGSDEPDGYIVYTPDAGLVFTLYEPEDKTYRYDPVYRHPPPARKMTDEEIEELYMQMIERRIIGEKE